jgi:tetrahydromethanopterin S-methyltransferase subunit F
MSFSFGNIILGLIGIAAGVWMIKDAFYINHHLYFLDFVERKWGPGSGTNAYRILGIVVCIFSIFVMVGILDLTYSSSGQNNQTNQNTPIRTVPVNNSIAP